MHITLPENLDDYSVDPEDLRVWSNEVIQQHKRLRITRHTAALLATYAVKKAVAMEKRLEARVPQAHIQELELENLYYRLPKKYRW
jgi:hypothetical protein